QQHPFRRGDSASGRCGAVSGAHAFRPPPTPSAHRTFLGVERSIAGRRWIERLDAEGSARALAMAQRHEMNDILARVLAGRGVLPDDAPAFLQPTLKGLMPDPSVLT